MKKIGLFVLVSLAVITLGFVILKTQAVNAEGETITTTTTATTGGTWYGMMGNGTGYGMMGNGSGYGMMGNRNGTTNGTETFQGPCYGVDYDTVSYEWLYVHLSEEDQHLVDVRYTELLAAIDLAPLTEAERILALDGVKAELVTFIQDSHFTIGYYRP
jgi:6-phosphogluconate dehydrogenase (decarboxylating)